MTQGNFDAWGAYNFGLLPLVMYREAGGQPDQAVVGVGWVVLNRVAHPEWWGDDIPSVILKHYQFSSFNTNDPGYTRFMKQNAETERIMRLAFAVYWKLIPDPTGGATYYYDKSMDDNPPAWSKTMKHTCDIGALHFYKEN